MKLYYTSIIVLLLFCISCNDASSKKKAASSNTTIASNKEVNTTIADYTTELVVADIDVPWGMTWLPDGSMLVTERSGTLYHVKDGKKTAVKNVPDVYARNQGGLLDITLHPDYAENGWIYITYSLVDPNSRGSHTILMRAKLEDNALVNMEKLYRGSPNVRSAHHFGSRIAFDKDGYVYFSIGDRGRRDENPQDLTKDGGKIYRLHDDGRIPEDNPFVDVKNAKIAIYSYGHRNPQGMIRHPETGKIWTHEHGPRGGDEINIIQKGLNYGWPVITYGINYSGSKITDETERKGMEQPLHYWTPSIAPSGMTFVTGDKYPELKNDLVVGSLKFQYLELVQLDGEKVVETKKLLEDIGRVRSVRQGPDGYLYVGVDGKGIYKIIRKGATTKTEKPKKVAEQDNMPEETVPVKKEAIVLTAKEKEALAASKIRGADLYTQFCVQCHMSKGEGYARVYPPLAKSDWLQGDKITESIKSIKYGLSGKITVNGKVYNSVMTPLGLNDKETADVMNYILNEWGNSYEGIITAKEVNAVKK